MERIPERSNSSFDNLYSCITKYLLGLDLNILSQIKQLKVELDKNNIDLTLQSLNGFVENYGSAARLMIRSVAAQRLISVISDKDPSNEYEAAVLTKLLFLDDPNILPKAFKGGPGFLALWVYFDEKKDQLLRIHVYDPRKQKIDESPHNHRFALGSMVLFGELYHTRVQTAIDPEGVPTLDCKCTIDQTILDPSNERLRVTNTILEVIKPGQVYHLKTGNYHKVEVNEQTITACVFTRDKEDAPVTIISPWDKSTERVVHSREYIVYPINEIRDSLGWFDNF